MIDPSELPRNNYKPLTGKQTVRLNINVLLKNRGNKTIVYDAFKVNCFIYIVVSYF